MNTAPEANENVDPEYREAQKRVRKIKSFYKELTGWASVSVILLGMDFFLSGGISWSKYPVFFYGLFVLTEAFNIIRLQKLDKQWEEKQLRKFTNKPISAPPEEALPEVDYSDNLLREKDKEMAPLSEYRKMSKPWKDDELV